MAEATQLQDRHPIGWGPNAESDHLPGMGRPPSRAAQGSAAIGAGEVVSYIRLVPTSSDLDVLTPAPDAGWPPQRSS